MALVQKDYKTKIYSKRQYFISRVTCESPFHQGEKERDILSRLLATNSSRICQKCSTRNVGKRNKGRVGFRHSAASKLKISIANSGKNNGMAKKALLSPKPPKLPRSYKTPEEIRITDYVRRSIRHLIRHKAQSRTIRKLGYSEQELRTRLKLLWEPWMSWNNYGKVNGWTIDHIVPISQFLKMNIKDISKINDLRNIQPISWAINSKKKDKQLSYSVYHWLLD